MKNCVCEKFTNHGLCCSRAVQELGGGDEDQQSGERKQTSFKKALARHETVAPRSARCSLRCPSPARAHSRLAAQWPPRARGPPEPARYAYFGGRRDASGPETPAWGQRASKSSQARMSHTHLPRLCCCGKRCRGARLQSRYAGALLGTWMEDTGGKSGRRPARHLQVEASGPRNATSVQQRLAARLGGRL